MDFMAFRVQLQNKYTIILLTVIALLPACTGNKGQLSVSPNNTALRQQGGFLYYDEKKFTGFIIHLGYNSDTLYNCQYKNGKQEGWETIRYNNGQTEELRFYKKGYKEGTHKGWYSNGQPRFEYTYKNDIYHGAVKEWAPVGVLFKHFNYKNGHEDGRQQLWYADGRLMANYDVRNGRKYGLTGVKNCINTNGHEKTE